MSGKYGHFCWYELMTAEPERAKTFYRTVVGWGEQADGDYTLLKAGEQPVAGLMQLTLEQCEQGARPGWVGYISVENADAAAGRITEAGGAVLRPPADIPNVGRFAVVADPQGAAFVLMQPDPYLPPAGVPPYTPGHTGWHELHAADGPAAVSFYREQFGWTEAAPPPTPEGAEPMAVPGFYALFTSNGGPAAGGIMTRHMAIPPHWLYYFSVASIDAAADKVREAGGQVQMGPMPVPGGGWILMATDAEGAAFALTGPRV